MEKLKIGIFFGGRSKEKEVSFAGGRTVYDNLDRRLYIPVPIFITEKNEFIKLKWEYIYKGSIKDFYPSEANNIGEKILIENLKECIDCAFLVLHGRDGEDGNIQGLLEWLNISYTGSKILGSALGINKIIQKQMMSKYGYCVNKYDFFSRTTWLEDRCQCLEKIKNEFQFPFVVKSANQGSSIGVSIVHNDNELAPAIDASLGLISLKKKNWRKMNDEEKINFINKNINEKHEYGFPVSVKGKTFSDTNDLIQYINENLEEEIIISSDIHDNEVLIEDFIEGREFSCIVLQEKNKRPQALFPTEIIKKNEIFDYRNKYMLGLTKKITPMNIEENVMNKIRDLSVQLFEDLHFSVFARIEGFLTKDNNIIFNDANTISGMEQISVLFQQAAYVHLAPKQLLTFIIQNSLNNII